MAGITKGLYMLGIIAVLLVTLAIDFALGNLRGSDEFGG